MPLNKRKVTFDIAETIAYITTSIAYATKQQKAELLLAETTPKESKYQALSSAARPKRNI